MSTATPSLSYAPTTCSHERGPGTAVCLRCRAEQHAQSSARLKRTLLRAGVVVVIVAIGIGIGGGAITASRGDSTPAPQAPAPSPAIASRPAAPAPVPASTPTPVPAKTQVVAPVAAAPVPTPAPAPVVVGPAPSPTIPRGRTELEGEIYADRTAGSVIVDFDTDELRTRHAGKFETVVRETLPAVYGARGDSLLDAVPMGQLTREGNLLTELPTRGIHLPAHKGWVMTLWPMTRNGRDGPIVIGYRTGLAKAK